MVNKNYKKLALLLCVLAMGLFIFGCSKGLVGDNTYRSTYTTEAANPNNPPLALRGEIQGIVRNVYGRPLQGMVASMAYENGDGVCKTRTATTDEYGHYNFLNVPVSGSATYDAVAGIWNFAAGTSAYTITIKDPSASPTYVTHYTNVRLDYQTLEQDSQIVTMGSELSVVGNLMKEAGAVMMLRPIADVVGKIQNRLTGAPIAGATVSLSMNAGLLHDMPTSTAVTNEAGEFTIADVPEGDVYDLTIYATGYQTIRLFNEVPVPKGPETILIGQPNLIAYADADAIATTGFSPGADGINATAYELLPGAPTPDTTAPYVKATNIPKFGAIPTSLLSGPFTVTWSEPMDKSVGTVLINTTAFKAKAPIPCSVTWSEDAITTTITPTTPIPAGMQVTIMFNGFKDFAGNSHNGFRAGVVLPAFPNIAEDAVSSFLGALDPLGRIPVGSVLRLGIATTSQGSSTLVVVANLIQKATTANPAIHEGGSANMVPQPNNMNLLDPTGLFIGPLGVAPGQADTVTMGWDAATGARRYNLYAELNTGGFLNGLPMRVYSTPTSGNPPTTAQLNLTQLETINDATDPTNVLAGFDTYNGTQPTSKKIPHIGPQTVNSPFGGLNLTDPNNPASATLLFFDNNFSLIQMAATAFNSEAQEGGFSNIVAIKDNVPPVVGDNGFGFDEALMFYAIPAPAYTVADTYSPLFAFTAGALTANGNFDIRPLRYDQTGAGGTPSYYNAASWTACSKAHGLLVNINEDLDTTQTLPTLTITTTGGCTITSASIPGTGVNRSQIQVNLSNITVLETGATIGFAGVKDEAGNLVPNDFAGKLRAIDRMGPFVVTAVATRTAGPSDTLTVTFQEAINDTDAKTIGNWCYQSFNWVTLAFGAKTGMPALFTPATSDITVSTDKKTVTMKFADGNLSGILAQGAAIYAGNTTNTSFVKDQQGNSFTTYGFLVKDEIAPRIKALGATQPDGAGSQVNSAGNGLKNEANYWKVTDDAAATVRVAIEFTEPVAIKAGGGVMSIAEAVAAGIDYTITPVNANSYSYPVAKINAISADGKTLTFNVTKTGTAAVANADKMKMAAKDVAGNPLDTTYDEIELKGGLGGGYDIK
jgi:hypothetical protein